MSGGVESRTILLTRIGDHDENDLRQHFESVNSRPDRKLVESVFIREGQDSAVVIFTEEKCKSIVMSTRVFLLHPCNLSMQ